MKRILLLSLLCVCEVVAIQAKTPWGVLPEAVDARGQYTQDFLLPKILAGQTLSISIQRAADVTAEQYVQDQKLVQEAFNEWFFYAAYLIEKQGRQQEFADILPALKKGIQIQFSAQGKDVDLSFRESVAQICNDKLASGCHSAKQGIHQIIVERTKKTRKEEKRILLHEFGHALGFADMYFGAVSLTADTLYGSHQTESVMGSAKELTCDDADGMINLMDIVLHKNRGGEQGWRSLCPKSPAYYINGMLASSGPYRILLDTKSADVSQVTVATYEKGKQTNLQKYPFALRAGQMRLVPVTSVQILKKDNLGRAVLGRGKNGETIYYAYAFDKVVWVAIANEKVLQYGLQVTHSKEDMFRKGQEQIYQFMMFGYQGDLVVAKGKKFYKAGCELIFAQGAATGKRESRLYAKQVYDQSGKLTQNVYQQSPSAQQATQNSLDSSVLGAQQKSVVLNALEQWRVALMQ